MNVQFINFSNAFQRPVTSYSGGDLYSCWRALSLAFPSTCFPLKDRNVHERLVIPGQTIILKYLWDIPRHNVWFEREWPCFASAFGFVCPRQWCVMAAVWGLKSWLCYNTFAFLWHTVSSALWCQWKERDSCCLPPGKCAPEHHILGFSRRILQCLHDRMTAWLVCCNCISGSFFLALPP